jgi:hypothetical protein
MLSLCPVHTAPHHKNIKTVALSATTATEVKPLNERVATPVKVVGAVGWALTDPVATTVLLIAEIALIEPEATETGAIVMVLAPAPPAAGAVLEAAPLVLHEVEVAFQFGYGTENEVAVGIV